MINKEQVVKALSLRSFGSMGWFSSNKCPCPECGRSDKFGILFTGNSGVVHCFHKDEYKTSLFNYLKHIDRSDLLSKDNYSIEKKNSLEPLKTIKNEDITECKLPIGFKRIEKDEYLDSRGFTELQYEKFQCGISNLEPNVENKKIFLIYQNNILRAWLARSVESKKWHDENRRRAKLGLEPMILRYENSSGTKFNQLLGGVDDIAGNTETVILVEGMFDKINIDNKLQLDYQESIKCCFTFGADCSPEQVRLLRDKKVKNIILLYDKGAEGAMKKAGSLLTSYFDVQVGIMPDDRDAGEADFNLLSEIFLNLKSFLYFYNSLNE